MKNKEFFFIYKKNLYLKNRSREVCKSEPGGTSPKHLLVITGAPPAFSPLPSPLQPQIFPLLSPLPHPS